jgi:hypothetical protein
VLVHAAAGATGQCLVRLARHFGAHVIGTVSLEEKAQVARAAGGGRPLAGGILRRQLAAAECRACCPPGCRLLACARRGTASPAGHLAAAPGS